MNRTILFILALIITPLFVFSQNNDFKFEIAKSFHQNDDEINSHDIQWGYLTVPENWEDLNGKKIKIAVALIKGHSKNANLNPILYIEGGPGAGSIDGIWSWLDDSLRDNSDIILVDVRGTGNSLPKFCPDLGQKFLEILSKNQNNGIDEQQKAIAAISCKQDLINRGIDINQYNSKSISKDLNALKQALKIKEWNVYGVSYGTYISQVYTNDFPNDIKSLILDSSIPNITEYYNKNTENYSNSLKMLFKSCENDTKCNEKYPNLEKTYFETIDKLLKKPITVKVDKSIVQSGYFTYNAEDFKISIQQALYKKYLIELLPLLITEFHNGNKDVLSSLVIAFSSSLSLDYGMYYCVSCNEVIPFNSLEKFNNNVVDKKLNGGLSFYRSDFNVCDKWNLGKKRSEDFFYDLSNLHKLIKPVLVFAGKYDPITPFSNGKATQSKFKKATLVTAGVFGHTPSFSKAGKKIVTAFISNPNGKLDVAQLVNNTRVNFVTDVIVNKGVAKMANSVNELNYLFFLPLVIAYLIVVISIFSLTIMLIKKNVSSGIDKYIRLMIIVSSVVSLFLFFGFLASINETANNNFYTFAFGLPEKFKYLFVVKDFLKIFTFLILIMFIFKNKEIKNNAIIFTIIFSLLVINTYYIYWEI